RRPTDRPQALDTGARPDAGKGGGGARQSGGPKAASPKVSERPKPKPRDTSFSNVKSGKATRVEANRGRQSYGGGGARAAPRVAGGGGGGGGRRGDGTGTHGHAPR